MPNALRKALDSDTSLSPDREREYASLFSKLQPTPLYRIANIDVPNGNRIWAKEEFRNPTQSAFDRIYPGLFYSLENKGLIVPGITPVIECSVGNAGASFAWSARELGYRATVITNEDTPNARIEQIKSYGADVIFSPALEYGTGYVRVLNEILEEDKLRKKGKVGENPERLFAVTKVLPEAKKLYSTLATEAASQLADAQNAEFNFFVSAVGSGDLICGVTESLRKISPDVRSVAVEPSELPVLSSLKNGEQIPDRPIDPSNIMIGVTAPGVTLDRLNVDFSLIDQIEQVSVAEWRTAEKLLSEKELKYAGRTTAGCLAVALRLAQSYSDKDFLMVFYDAAWKYGDKLPSDCGHNNRSSQSRVR